MRRGQNPKDTDEHGRLELEAPAQAKVTRVRKAAGSEEGSGENVEAAHGI